MWHTDRDKCSLNNYKELETRLPRGGHLMEVWHQFPNQNRSVMSFSVLVGIGRLAFSLSCNLWTINFLMFLFDHGETMMQWMKEIIGKEVGGYWGQRLWKNKVKKSRMYLKKNLICKGELDHDLWHWLIPMWYAWFVSLLSMVGSILLDFDWLIIRNLGEKFIKLKWSCLMLTNSGRFDIVRRRNRRGEEHQKRKEKQ